MTDEQYTEASDVCDALAREVDAAPIAALLLDAICGVSSSSLVVQAKKILERARAARREREGR
jgi:hypothetical protein